MNRPDCFERAMEFLGDPEESAIREYVQLLEKQVANLSSTAEELARQFHDTYERLAPEYGYETRADTKKFDPASPNGRLMIAVCQPFAAEIERLRADVKELSSTLAAVGRVRNQAVAAERERCARICEKVWAEEDDKFATGVAAECAAAIRRGEE